MGKYVPEDSWIATNETEQEIRRILGEYNENIHKYESKGYKTAGIRSRNNLLALYPLLKQRRKEILDGYKNRKDEEHPSWKEVEDAD
jgi:hypothetical protein